MVPRRSPAVPLAVTALVVGLAPGAAAAQEAEDTDPEMASESDASGIDLEDFIVDVDGPILDLEWTIVDVEAGTGVTESVEEITITLDADVFFDFDADVLRPDAQAALGDVAARVRDDGAAAIHIAGHTDSVGDPAYNQALSERRAAAVEAFLAAELGGVEITTEGYGATRPVAPNETEDGQDFPEGRALNRRVEITYPQ